MNTFWTKDYGCVWWNIRTSAQTITERKTTCYCCRDSWSHQNSYWVRKFKNRQIEKVYNNIQRICFISRLLIHLYFYFVRLVLDECDRLLDVLPLRRDLQAILRRTPREKQVMMFSATINESTRSICKKIARNVLLF